MDNKEQDFVSHILSWNEKAACSFPWRTTNDPYKILVSEMLLRKTTRHQVAEVFQIFFERFPTFLDLAKARASAIERVIRPLGMEHKRSFLLKNAAEEVMRKYEGRLPMKKEELLTLPGVGEYTANAVLCLSEGLALPLLDRNVARVLRRVFSLETTSLRIDHDEQLWLFSKTLLPDGRAREFNLAILDFAGLICKARNPECEKCPIRRSCGSYPIQKMRAVKKGLGS